jgi:formylglycine-generating enzyme required for sulfatase activity
MTNGKIFISYRRADSAYAAGRLYDRLATRFGEENIFMDVEVLEPGVDFVETIKTTVNSCKVLISLVGPQWLNIKDHQDRRRLDNPHDFVRLEIATAFRRGIRVVPILVQGAHMPNDQELPNELKPLARLHALSIRHEHFNSDADRLTRAIGVILQSMGEKIECERQAQELIQHEAQIPSLLAKARIAEEKEDWQTAQRIYQCILKLRNDHTVAHRGFKMASQNMDLARLYRQALLYQDEGQYERALQHLRNIHAKDPGYRDVEELISAFETRPKRQVAAKSLSEKKQSSPNASSVWLYLGGAITIVLFFLVLGWGVDLLYTSLQNTEVPRPAPTNAIVVETNTHPAITVLASSTPKSLTTNKPTNLLPSATVPPSLTVPMLLTSTADIGISREGYLTQTKAALFTLQSTGLMTATPHPTDFPLTGGDDLPAQITDNFGVPMVLIPAGAFKMGSNDGRVYEKPVHTVVLDDYYIDQYEVTNARYARCVDSGSCIRPNGNYYADVAYENHPIVNVTWYDAMNYCEWRNARLPTEAEWEKAARGGLSGEPYPWGNSISCMKANYSTCIVNTAPVGSYSPNGYDLYDMVGNVREWTSSLYQNYPYDETDGRENMQTDGLRVVRGGGWSDVKNYLRVSLRYGYIPSITLDYRGFRCARSP